jgi:hypothetical protein
MLFSNLQLASMVWGLKNALPGRWTKTEVLQWKFCKVY